MTFPTEAETRKFLRSMKLDPHHIAIIPATHGYWTYTDLEESKKPAKICSICQQRFHEFGNNAEPVNDGRCCNFCDEHIVWPARCELPKEVGYDV